MIVLKVTWKSIAQSLGFLCLGTGLFTLYLYFYFLDTNPTICEPRLGKIYPLYNHGQVAYIDLAEKWTLDGLQLIALLFFGIGFLIYRWKRIE